VDGLVSALGWLSVEQAQTHIQSLLRSDKPVDQRVGIATAAAHRDIRPVSFAGRPVARCALKRAR